jgi:hypothetical protein
MPLANEQGNRCRLGCWCFDGPTDFELSILGISAINSTQVDREGAHKKVTRLQTK